MIEENIKNNPQPEALSQRALQTVDSIAAELKQQEK